MSESKISDFKTSTSFKNNNNNENFIPTFASQEPFLKFDKPIISHNCQKKDYLKSMHEFVTLNEKENFGIECPKEGQLPNYIVPVLYVPHRIVTNEELLKVTQFYQPYVKTPQENIPKQNNKSKGILTDSESEIYQRLTNKLDGLKTSESDHDDGTTDNKSCFKNLYEYNNPHYTIISNSENCFSVSSSSQNKVCPILPKSVTSNDALRITDNTQNASNIKSPGIKNKNAATPKRVYPERSGKRVHSKILKFVQEKNLRPDADFVPHLESKITQTKHKVIQISTQTKRKEEEISKSKNKDFSSCTNVPELLGDYLIFNDGIEIITPEDFIEASFIPLVSSPLDEIMTPKLKTHSKKD